MVAVTVQMPPSIVHASVACFAARTATASSTTSCTSFLSASTSASRDGLAQIMCSVRRAILSRPTSASSAVVGYLNSISRCATVQRIDRLIGLDLDRRTIGARIGHRVPTIAVGFALDELRTAAAPDAIERMLGRVIDLEYVHAIDLFRRDVVGGCTLVAPRAPRNGGEFRYRSRSGCSRTRTEPAGAKDPPY